MYTKIGNDYTNPPAGETFIDCPDRQSEVRSAAFGPQVHHILHQPEDLLFSLPGGNPFFYTVAEKNRSDPVVVVDR
jgi:hypothetical protein